MLGFINPLTMVTLFSSVLGSPALDAVAPEIQVQSGDILRGSVCPDTHVKRFRGIPFAQPPVDSLRFLSPKSINGSITRNGTIFDASRAAPPCPQFKNEFRATSPTPSENCLTLDVYMPAKTQNGAKLPVKVWMYGGFNQVGATSYPLYDACHLATDSIVVEFNYRVGPLGFLGLNSAGIRGNMAIEDALEALKWVQKNIDSFDGNRSQVLLFGQSAGADDAFVVSTLPEAPGLISAVVAQSGGGQFLTPFNIAQSVGSKYASVLQCKGDDLFCLQSRTIEELAEAYAKISIFNESIVPGQALANQGSNIPNTYVMDNAIFDGTLIRHEPLKVGPRVPIVAGATQNDAALFTVADYENSEYPITIANYTSFVGSWGSEIGAKISQMYPLSAFNTTGSTAKAVVEAITYIMTDATFICPSYFILQAAEASGTDAYGYRFNHTPSCPWLQLPGVGDFPNKQMASQFGATHTSDVPFVFGNLNNMPYNNGTCNSTASEYMLSRSLTTAWTAMASYGNPATGSLDWPRYTSCLKKGISIQDTAYVSKLDFQGCEFWGNVWQQLAGVDLPYLAGNASCSERNNGSLSSYPSNTSGNTPSNQPTAAVPVSESTRTSLNVALIFTWFLATIPWYIRAGL